MKLIAALLVSAGCGLGVGQTTQQLCTQDPNGPCCPGSPIIVDMAGDGIALTGPEDGVVFQLRAGTFGLSAWTEAGADDSFLALDRNHDGVINDGSELFGDGSLQVAGPSPNGFNALAYFDMFSTGGNDDGRITSEDSVWKDLRLWRDVDHNGYSSTDELITLDAAGVHSFSLMAVPSTDKDEHGNEFRFMSTIVADAPTSMTVHDVWLQQLPLPDPDGAGRTERDWTQYTCWGWVYAVVSTAPNPACANPATWNDLHMQLPGGQWVTRVSRYSQSSNKNTAINAAYNAVWNAVMVPPPGWDPCYAVAYPIPDTFISPPYERQGGSTADYIRISCTSSVIHTGGGGGCLMSSPLE